MKLAPRQQRAFLWSLLVVLAFAAEWRALSWHKEQLLKREEQAITDRLRPAVMAEAKELMRPEVFANPRAPESAEAFSTLFHRLQTPQLVRFKAWSPDSTVLWSNYPEIIGQHYADNEALAEAVKEGPLTEIEMAGETESEHVSERSFEVLSETYVPLTDENGTVYGVIEMYQSAHAATEHADQQWGRVAYPAAGLTMLVAGSVLWFVLRRHDRPKRP